MNNTVLCAIGARKTGTTVTRAIWQNDFGMKLKFVGLDLPMAYEVDFAADKHGAATRMVGDADGVDIPNALLETGTKALWAWLFLHNELNDGYTVYEIKIPVLQRPAAENASPTPAQQDAIDVAIAALQEAVERTAADVVESDENAERAENAADRAETAESGAETSETEARNYSIAAGQSAAQANTSAGNASASASAAQTARTGAETAQSAAETARAGAETAQGRAETAQTAAETAQTAAQYAQGKAEDAQGHAEAAQTAAQSSAQSAYEDAERAEQAASTAGYMEMQIIDGELIYTRTDAVDVDFSIVDGDLWMEAV